MQYKNTIISISLGETNADSDTQLEKETRGTEVNRYTQFSFSDVCFPKSSIKIFKFFTDYVNFSFVFKK
jgi:hypothetical protein